MLLPLGLPVQQVSSDAIASEGPWTLVRPRPYRMRQSSSYDRRSTTPGTPDWFANEDWGKYLREETNEGRREWVIADLKGPGALVRQWTANPLGVWRYYFDGETTPRLSVMGKDLAAGRFPGLSDPDVYVASRGVNVYFPFTYKTSLKVTVDASDGDPMRMYYVLGHRDYPAGWAARTFSELDFRPVGYGVPQDDFRETLRPAGSVEAGGTRVLMDRKEGETVLSFEFTPTFPTLPADVPWSHTAQRHNILRNLVIEGEFDGESCLSVPISDFFGSPPSGAPYKTSYSEVREDGTMEFHLRMPYQKSARVLLRNMGREPVRFRSKIEVLKGADPGALLLHAQYRRHPGPSRPNRDMAVAHLRGRGHYVGTVLHVANPSTAWWGEGDEKVRVDGEAFPSLFGTGTEDYFGYAWSSNLPFSRPYHAQPSAGSRGNSGQIANVRWHVLDPIPYKRSLNFDLELWHWADTKSHFATTAFWYAAPGGTPATPLKRSDLAVPEIVLPKPEPGAIQGEALPAEITGGTTEVQSGFEELADAQLWWRDPVVGDRLTLRLPKIEPGRYRVEMRTCYAKDYGRHEIVLGGKSLGTRDFYAPKLAWKRLNLGTIDLKDESPTLEIRALAPNPKAEPRRMFGLDWIKLVRVR